MRRRPQRPWPSLVLVAALAVTPLSFPGAVAVAQEEAASPAAEDAPANPSPALEGAREALEAARGAPGPRHPDAPAWSRALARAEEALQLSRGGDEEPEALALLARVYQDMRWWSRAVDVWNELEARLGELEPEARSARRRATGQVAFARYGAGDLEGAERHYRAILDEDPEDAEALAWIGRIALEQGRNEAAAEAFSNLLEVQPGDAGARFHLELAQERLAHGAEASEAYRRGLSRFEAGDLAEAAEAFAAARAAAPEWLEPSWWRARTLLDLGRSEEAVAAWQEVVAVDPRDADATWFLERARLEARVGRAAASAADDARAAREAGNPAEAARAWSRAVAEAPSWLEARLRLGRAALEAGDRETADAAFRAVLERAPAGDPVATSARAGLERVALYARLGTEAGTAYAEALEAYERNDMNLAEERLRHVVRLVPSFADAWGWLGRLAFARSDWAEAAEAYERAAALKPGDDDFAFFAEEARSLAGPAAEPLAPDPQEEP